MEQDRVQELAFARTGLRDAEREHRLVSEALRIVKVEALARIYDSGEFLSASNERLRQQAIDEALLRDEAYMGLLGDEYAARDALEGARLMLDLAQDRWRAYAYGVLEALALGREGPITLSVLPEAGNYAGDLIAGGIVSGS